MGRAGVRHQEDADASTPSVGEAACEAFVAVQALSKQWMEKEREGISLIESFQTALLACRGSVSLPNRAAPDTRRVKKDSAMMPFITGGDATAGQMDPWLAEDLYAQIKELHGAFSELLDSAYAAHASVKVQYQREKDSDTDDAVPTHALVLTTTEYLQLIAHEIATFEAEYQHIEALLAMVSFDITTDQLRTLVISWSTSPFLDPERSRQLRQRHEQSQKLRS